MTIPANISTELSSLQAQVTAATPLSSASQATITAMQLNAGNLVGDVQSALTAASTLDTWVAPIDPVSIAAGFNNLVEVSEDQSTLSLLRGVTGRVAANLDQLA